MTDVTAVDAPGPDAPATGTPCTEAPAPDPRHAFDDSRRLTGPNRGFAGTAVTLTAGGPLAADPAAHARWAAQVQALAQALGWPAPQPQALVRHSETTLHFAAPAGLLFTATEVNEWAWEAACRASRTGTRTDSSTPKATAKGQPALDGFDLAHPWALATPPGTDAGPGSEPRPPATDDDPARVHAHFSALAAAELNPALQALCEAANAHGLPALVDDEALSLGTGRGSSTWLLTDLPRVEDVPWAQLHAVPTALVTGSNGKTTTVRLLAAMAAHAGLVAGQCSTEAVVVGGQVQQQGDYAGPAGARTVLRDRRVQLAVLETARGGLLRRGLALSRADVAVVTNLAVDHFGEYGIESLDDLAEVKLVVARALGGGGGTGGTGTGTGPNTKTDTGSSALIPPGLLVLNADDRVLMAAAARLPHAAGARQGFFSLDHHHPALVAWRAQGGATCGVDGQGRLLLHTDGATRALVAVGDMPLSLGGAASHNVANAAAAALAAWGLGLAPEHMAAALHSFGADPADNAGRLEHRTYRGATVLLDYAHNPEGLAQLLQVAQRLLAARGRLGLLLGQAGNRDDAALAELARVAARFQPDRVLLKELPAMLRGRAAGEVSAGLARGLRDAGLPAERIALQADEAAAALELLAWARPGDVLVLPVHTAAVRTRLSALLSAQPGR